MAQHEAQINSELAMEALIEGVPAAVVTAMQTLVAGDVTKLHALTASAAEINKLDNATVTVAEINLLDNQPALCSVATAAGAANAADTTITIKDAAGITMTKACMMLVWLSSDADGLALATAQDAFAVKAAGGTSMGALTANKVLLVLSNANGTIVVTTTDAGKAAFYVNAMPLAGHVVSTGTVTAGTDYGA